MKVNYLTKNTTEQCHANMSIILEEVLRHKRQTLAELFHDEHLLHTMNAEMKELELVRAPDTERPNSTDAQNAQIVYEAMQNLTDSQASEENLWAAYTLILQRDYMIWRWKPASKASVKSHFLFGHGAHRSLFRNGMSRLWWIARITKDTRLPDPYALTKYVCSHADIIQSILEQPVFQSPSMMRGTIRAMYDLDMLDQRENEQGMYPDAKRGVHIEKIAIQKTGQFMNMKAGTYLLDIYSEKEIHDMVQRFIRKLNGITN